MVRAVRLLTHLDGPRRVAVALVASVPVLFNIFLLILLLWFPFAVIGMQLFKGCYWTCSPIPNYASDEALAVSAAACPSDHYWVRMMENYDNIFTSFRTAHILSTADGWTGIMWVGVDRTGPGGAQVIFPLDTDLVRNAWRAGHCVVAGTPPPPFRGPDATKKFVYLQSAANVGPL